MKSVLYGMAGRARRARQARPDGSPAAAARSASWTPDAVAAGLARAPEPARACRIWPAPGRGAERTMLPLAARTPYFCSGCPHNSSTKVAPGTLVGGGIGCHAMVLLMPEEQGGTVTGLTQMGGEGAQWIGMAPFVAPASLRAEHRRRHLHPLRQPGHPGGGRRGGERHLQAAAQLGGGDDRRPAGDGRAAGRPAARALLPAEGVRKVVVTSDDPAAAARGRPGDGARRQAPGRPAGRAAGTGGDRRRDRAGARPGVRGGEAPQAPPRARRRRRPGGCSSTSGSARGAATAASSPTACRCSRWRPSSAARPGSTSPRATWTSPAWRATARPSSASPRAARRAAAAAQPAPVDHAAASPTPCRSTPTVSPCGSPASGGPGW